MKCGTRGHPRVSAHSQIHWTDIMEIVGPLLTVRCTRAMIALMLNAAGKRTAHGRLWSPSAITNLLRSVGARERGIG
jgi:hypothetical protein